MFNTVYQTKLKITRGDFMVTRDVHCPECGQVHKVTNQTETKCFCGSKFIIERDRTKRPMEIKFIKKS